MYQVKARAGAPVPPQRQRLPPQPLIKPLVFRFVNQSISQDLVLGVVAATAQVEQMAAADVQHSTTG